MAEIVLEVWASVRPFLIKMIVDAILSWMLWVFLWLFKFLTHFLSIDGWAGEWISNIHSVGAVLAFASFAILFFIDVIKLHQKDH